MSSKTAAAGLTPSERSDEAPVSRRLGSYFQLTKPRLNLLVLTTTFVGAFVATEGPLDLPRFFHGMMGTAMVAGGSSALNMYLERELDGRMARTAGRPLPAGRLAAWEALAFGLLLSLVGAVWLAVLVNPLTAALGLVSMGVYVLAYTPMKVRSTFNTAVGAISGALPPVMGWTAIRGTLDVEAAVLFAILFLWQHPHFFALAWMYRADYERGGYAMLPRYDRDGALSGRLMVLFSLALIPASLALTLTGLTGLWYAGGALLLSGLNLWKSLSFVKERTTENARAVFRASILYLPALLCLMMLDLRP